MKKILTCVSLLTALVGCGGESLEEVQEQSTPVFPGSTVVFDPANSRLSVPHDLLFLGTTDGTLTFDSAENADYSNPQTALGALDGWSTQVPFALSVDLASGFSLVAESVQKAGTVQLFHVIMGADQSDDFCKQVPAGVACKGVAELQYGVDFVTQAQGNNILVVPLKPLPAETSYIVVVTDQLQDQGQGQTRAVNPSSSYFLLSQDPDSAPLADPDQKQLQVVIDSYEDVVTGLGVDRDSIIYSAPFTTQSVGKPMVALKGLMAQSLSGDPSALPRITLDALPALTVADVSSDLAAASPLFSQVQYKKGSIALPSYRQAPEFDLETLASLQPAQIGGYLQGTLTNSRWVAACDNAVAVAGARAQQGANFPEEAQSANDGFCLAVSGGALRDLGLDSVRHLTKFNSIPKVQTLESVPVQITLPADDLTVINATRASLGLPALEKPAAGWPVVILQHGITGNKEQMLALTAALSLQGLSTVAIDHPLHGERGIDFNGDGRDEINASSVSTLHYMNLASLLAARDNIRQSSADLLGLRFALNFSGLADMNPLDVSFAGLSLGALSVQNFLTLANESIGNAQVDPLFSVQAAALSSAAGGIAGFLSESIEFGPIVQGNVLLGAGIDESTEFQQLLANPPTECLSFATDPLGLLGCVYTVYTQGLAASGDTDSLAAIQAVVGQFIFAAQTVLDPGDANNFVSRLSATGLPTYLFAFVGDGENNRPDTVIPPQSTIYPLAGSLPLAKLMNLTSVVSSVQTENGMSYLGKFIKGHHGSLLTPLPTEASGATAADAAAVNAELQLQVATYLATKGRVLPVTKPELLMQ